MKQNNVAVPIAGFRRPGRGRVARIGGAVLALAALAGASAGPALAVPVSTAVPAPASSSSRPIDNGPPRAFFGLAPANAKGIDGRPYFNWSATPGSFLTDHVAVVNLGATTVTLRLFASSAVATEKGGMSFKPGLEQVPPASWVTIQYPNGSDTLTLAPHSTVILPVTVVIPKTAPPGDHVGGFIASMSSYIDSKNHIKVHFVQQVADRIIARVAGTQRPGLTVAAMSVRYQAPVSPFSTGTATVRFTVINSGNEMLGGNVTVSVQGFLGSAETLHNVVRVPVMLPGGEDAESVVVHGVYPEIFMTANVSVSPTTLTGQYDTGLTKYTGSQGFLAIPWLLLLIVIGLIAIVAGLWFRDRRRRNGPAATAASRKTQPAGAAS